MMGEDAIGLESYKVHPFCFLINELIDEFTMEDLDIMKTLASDKLHGHDVKDLYEFFERLYEKFERKDESMIEFLKSMAQLTGRHVDDEPLLSKLKRYEERISNEREMVKANGTCKDKHFVGRRKEIVSIGKFLKNMQTITIEGVYISGLAGMGKTSLATEVCFRATSPNIIRINKLRGKKTLSDFYISILHGLAMPCAVGSMKKAVSQSEDMLRQLVHNKLDAIQRNTIIFLDDIDDVYEFNEGCFLQVIQAFRDIHNNKVKLLLTSRRSLVAPGMEEGRMSVALGYLSVQEAEQLLRLSAGNADMGEDDAREIVQLCTQCPLLVKMVGTYMSSYNICASEMRQQLTNDQLDQLDETLQIEYYINKIFEAQPKIYRNYLVALSVFEAAFDSAMAGSVMRRNGGAEVELNYLKQRHFVEVDRDGVEEFRSCRPLAYQDGGLNNRSETYSLHPLVLSVLRKKCEPENSQYHEVKQDAEQHFLQYFMEYIKTLGQDLNENSPAVFTYIDDMKVHLQKFMKSVGDGMLHIEVSNKNKSGPLRCLSKIQSFLSNRQERIEFFRNLAQKKAEEGDQLSVFFLKTQQMFELIELNSSEDICRKTLQGELKTMLPRIEAMASKPLQPLALADYYHMLAKSRWQCSDQQEENTRASVLNEALDYYDKALSIRHQWSKADLAAVTNGKGSVYFELNEYHEAIKLHKKARGILEKYIHTDLHTDIATYLMNIGSDYQALGSIHEGSRQNVLWGKALEHYSKALDIHRKLGPSVEVWEARLTRNLADLHRQMRQYNEAASHALRAFELFHKHFNHPHTELTLSLHIMGFVEYCKGRYLIDAAHNILTDEAEQALLTSTEYYDQVRHEMSIGGLPVHHRDVPQIGRVHKLVLTILDKQQQLDTVKNFYEDFEAGKFENDSPVEAKRLGKIKMEKSPEGVGGSVDGELCTYVGGNLGGPVGGELVGPEGGELVCPVGFGPVGGELVEPEGGELVGPEGGELVGPEGGELVGEQQLQQPSPRKTVEHLSPLPKKRRMCDNEDS